jgi:hypothetical protein
VLYVEDVRLFDGITLAEAGRILEAGSYRGG